MNEINFGHKVDEDAAWVELITPQQISIRDASQTQLRRHLVVVAQNLEKASEDLQRLLDVLSKHPSQLMFGEPPRPRMVEPERK